MKLSERTSSISELAPWVLEQIKTLEQENERLLIENKLLKKALEEEDEGVDL